MSQKIKTVFCGLTIVAMLFPYYQFAAHPDVMGWYIDFLIVNVLFILAIIYGGRWSVLFGGSTSFQRW